MSPRVRAQIVWGAPATMLVVTVLGALLGVFNDQSLVATLYLSAVAGWGVATWIAWLRDRRDERRWWEAQ